jgi:hypothetical protein
VAEGAKKILPGEPRTSGLARRCATLFIALSAAKAALGAGSCTLLSPSIAALCLYLRPVVRAAAEAASQGPARLIDVVAWRRRRP